MAIDTAAKRAAALGVGQPPGVILPPPDGAINAADRAALNGGYALAAGTDSIPDAFVFSDTSGVALSSLIISSPIVVAGIDTGSAITVSGGEYSINGAAFTSAGGTVNNGDSVRARVTSSGSYSTAANVAVTIGGVSDTFTATTQSAPGVGGIVVTFRRRRRR